MAMTEEIPLDKSSFESELRDLQNRLGKTEANPGSYKCSGCKRCYGCMFTTDSVDCFGCTHCSDCERCSGCTHCRRCEGCHDSSYCVDSSNCSNSSYLVKSQNCSDCVFCFGCVGLVGEEFCILNKKFSRKEYFEKLEELERAFGLDLEK